MTDYILAFDTSANSVSIALLNGQQVVAETYQPMERGQGEALIPMIITLLEKAKVDISEIKKIAVSIGPGSFTGVRVGLSAARGMGLALGIPVCGITTLEASAFNTKGAVLSVFDTKRGDFYTQLFKDGHPLENPTIRTVDEIKTISCDALVGSTDKTLEAQVHKKYIKNQSALAVNVGYLAKINPRAPEPLYLREADVTC